MWRDIVKKHVLDQSGYMADEGSEDEKEMSRSNSKLGAIPKKRETGTHP